MRIPFVFTHIRLAYQHGCMCGLIPAYTAHWRDQLTWTFAMLLPRKVALYAFVRVYAVIGRCGPEYSEVYKAWEARTR